MATKRRSAGWLYRALDLVYPPEPAEVPSDATPAEVLKVALRNQYSRLLTHDPGTRLGTDPEDLHQMRVATRRARAFLRAARPLLDPAWAEELRAELGWLGSVLGPARDLDVLLDHVRGEVQALGDEGAPLRGLVESLEHEHADAYRAVLAALSLPRYFALLDRLEDEEPVLAPAAKETLTDLWWDEFRRTRRRFARLGARSGDDELHAARIRVKRARYSAELSLHALGKPGERFVDAAKQLQDVLGEHQDACVAEERIAAWAEGEPDRAVAATPLVERQRKRRKKARLEWPEAWEELHRRARKARP